MVPARLKLYKGNCIPAGVKSPNSLYMEEIATFGDSHDLYSHKDSEGFINLLGLPLKVKAHGGSEKQISSIASIKPSKKHRRGRSLSDLTVKKPSGGVGGAAAPLTFLRVSRLCRLRGSLILLAKSNPYKFGRPLVDRICFLEKVASATFSTR